MAASTREEIGEAFNTLRAAMSRVCNLTFDALATPEHLTYFAHLETIARQMPVPGHALINRLSAQATKAELSGSLRGALADRLRIPGRRRPAHRGSRRPRPRRYRMDTTAASGSRPTAYQHLPSPGEASP